MMVGVVMGKFGDIRSSGKSKLVPFIPGEDPRDRHDRRLLINLAHEKEVQEFCLRNRIHFSISNGGHHWIFKRGRFWRAEWFPSSAKYVQNKNWDGGVHVHDYVKLIEQLKRHFGAQ